MIKLKDRTIKGVFWSALSRLSNELILLLTLFVLARLLSPDSFGLLGMVTVFTAFISVFQDLGLGPSIVQDQNIKQKQLSSIFWLNLTFSLILSVITVVSAPFVASFYGQPVLAAIMMVLSLNFPLSALAIVHVALINKNMDFKKLAFIQNTAGASGAAVGITIAFLGWGVWALVLQLLIRTFINSSLHWIIVPWKPSPILQLKKIREQLDFGLKLMAGSILIFLSRNIDDLLIGKFIGVGALGVYQMSYRLMLWPLQRVSHVIGQVMFPALSSIQDDKERVKSAFIQATSSTALVAFPIVLGSWTVIPHAVYVLLGEKWIGVIPIFQVLCIAGLFQSVVTNVGWIFLSQGRTDLMLKLLYCSCFVVFLFFIIGINWGAIGVAIFYTIASVLLTPVNFMVSGSIIDMTFGDILRAISGIFGCAMLMVLGVWSFGLMLPSTWPHWAYLALQVPFGVAVYVTLIHFFRLSAYLEIRDLLSQYILPKFQFLDGFSRRGRIAR